MLPYETKDCTLEQLRESLIYWIRLETLKDELIRNLKYKLDLEKAALNTIVENIQAIQKEINNKTTNL